MMDQENKKQSLTANLFAPVMIGLGYALSRSILTGFQWDGVYWQSPFMVSVFSGILITLACRPVLARVPWSRGVAVGLTLSLLAGLGPLAQLFLAWLISILNLAPFPYYYSSDMGPEILGIVAAAFLMGLLFRPNGGHINWGNLRVRLFMRRRRDWALRISLFVALTLVIWLLLGWIDAVLISPKGSGFPPLIRPNLWLLISSHPFPTGGFGGNGDGSQSLGMVRGVMLLALYALRGLALFLPLLPILLLVRGSWMQLTLMLSLLLFVLGEFVPLMLDQPYPSTLWLLSRTGLGLARSVLLAALAARLLGQIRD